MENKSFWLANISDDTLTVSLVDLQSGQYKVIANGSEALYQSTPDSFVAAIDQSLSEAANSINLPEDSEPNSIALIISPFWVSSDGKITPAKIQLFEKMFKELKLKPMGFICYDDAIVEEANISDGFPASFIVVKVEANSFIASLTYLGKVIERISKPISDSLNPADIETTLTEFKTDSTLPPQIILLGDINEDQLDKVKNYSWIGKKNIETFLHFPDIKKYSNSEILSIYTIAITSQFQPQVFESIPEIQKEDPIVLEESEALPATLSEVSADEFGFGESDNFIIPEPTPEPIIEDIVPTPTTPKIKFKINFPKINLPKFRLPFKNIFLIPLVISPLLILIPFYFSTAKIILYITPYEFSKTVNVNLDPDAKSIDLNKKIVPVNQKTFDITNSVTIDTTGQKIIGQKSQGEVTIFNKQDKTQNLPKGTIIVDGASHKFELITSVQVASSSSNLSLGVITLGQTKAMVSAIEIGPESNLSKDTILNFNDFSSSILVAKVSDSLSGGSKTEVRAVSAADKSKVEAQLSSEITASVNDKISQELSNTPGILRESVQIKKGRFDANREIGEEANELTVSVISTVSLYYFDNSQKMSILESFLSTEPGFKETIVNPNDFNIVEDKGKLSITGKSLPQVDTTALIRSISGKSQSSAISLIKKTLPRVYNYQIFTNFSFLKSINPLPFRVSNINIEVK